MEAARAVSGTTTKPAQPTPVLPYGLSFDDLANAFKTGFLSQKISRKSLKKEMDSHNKDLGAYLDLMSLLEENSETTVLLAVKGSFKTDELGRLVYTNKYFFADLNPRLFPVAFYLKSLVED